MEMFQYMIIWLIAAAISGIIGALIGGSRGQGFMGFVCGLFLGPVGWIIALVLPDHRPKCPHCKKGMPEGATRCPSCGGEIMNKKLYDIWKHTAGR